MADTLKTNKITSLREIYSMFDKTNMNNVNFDHLGVMLRYIGENPTQAEVANYIEELKTEKENLSFEDFLSLYLEKFNRNRNSEDELIESFAYFEEKDELN